MNRTVAKILIWSVIGCVVLFGAAYGIGFYLGSRDAGAPGAADGPEVPAWLFFIVVSIVMAGSIWVGAIWMRSIDEAAQEAHKWAWYWGGSCGMAVGAVFALASMLPQAADLALPSLWEGRTDPAAYFAAGAALMVLVMTGGYTIAWAVWWLRRR
ncbi:hypothetical protein HZ989_00815 [Brevundimonas sp. AJA228-03]|uniref:hypothetical protein n=1 Tax=Brevundimonas sp. AJA228-03 TaxID=2752515 RepID=UPI001AE02A53|nr:hypothetical protein [Brevundimonas sp. AJA228-03]QTN19658.1 hypothetical protein HZ989_00815 [Brevundimonas sp. AJA228-03]